MAEGMRHETSFKVSHRRSTTSGNHAGRFGGGWDWKLGVQTTRGARTILLSLLVLELRIERKDRRGR